MPFVMHSVLWMDFHFVQMKFPKTLGSQKALLRSSLVRRVGGGGVKKKEILDCRALLMEVTRKSLYGSNARSLSLSLSLPLFQIQVTLFVPVDTFFLFEPSCLSFSSALIVRGDPAER